jgi:hypothetical protein
MNYALENRKRNKMQAVAGLSEEQRLRLGAVMAKLGKTDRSEPLSSSRVKKKNKKKKLTSVSQ